MKNNTIKKSLLAIAMASGSLLATGLALNTNNSSEEIILKESKNSNIKGSSETDTKPLKIWVSWTEGGTQWKALEALQDYYNKNNGTNLDVQMVKKTGNYNGITEQIQMLIITNTLSDLPDMYVGYSDVASSLIYLGNDIYGKPLTLDLGHDSEGNPKDITDDLLESLIESNKYIAGGKEDELYTIPFAVSSEMMTIDAPLFIWLLQEYANAGGVVTVDGAVMRQVIDSADGLKDGQTTVTEKDGTVVNNGVVDSYYYHDPTSAEVDISSDNYILNLQTGTEEDLKTIKSQWIPTGNDLKGSSISITDETFNSAEAMLELGNELFLAVQPVSTDKQGFMGYDAVSNNFYTYAQGLLDSGNNHENGLLSKNGDTVDFNMLDQNSVQWNTSEEIIDFFLANFETGTLWVPNNGVLFGSDQFNQHSLPFSIGSTAGGSYFGKEEKGDVNPGEVVFTQAPGRLYEEGTQNVQMQQGPGLGAIKQFRGKSVSEEDVERNDQIQIFIDWLTGEELITIGDFTGTPSQYMSQESGYIFGTKSSFESDEYKAELTAKETSSNGTWSADGTTFTQNPEGKFGKNTLLGPSIAYQNIETTIEEDASTKSETNAVIDPAELEIEPSSVDTAAFRTSIGTEIQQQKVNAVNHKKMSTAEDILIDLHNEGVKGGYVKGGKIFTGLEWWAWMIIAIIAIIVLAGIGFGISAIASKGKNKKSNTI